MSVVFLVFLILPVHHLHTLSRFFLLLPLLQVAHLLCEHVQNRQRHLIVVWTDRSEQAACIGSCGLSRS